MLQDLFFGRKPVRIELAVDDLAVNFDVENAASACDQCGIDPFGFFDCGRQTGGLWRVVSLHAVGDGNLHLVLLFNEPNDGGV